MKFMIYQNDKQRLRDAYCAQIVRQWEKEGHSRTSDPDEAKFVLNVTDIDSPQIYRRRSRAIFVVSVVVLQKSCADLRTLCYRMLVRTLSNLLICIVPQKKGLLKSDHLPHARVYFTTPEAGFYFADFDSPAIYRKMLPIVGAHLAIANSFSVDLPRAYRKQSAVVDQIRRHGKKLDELGVLPAPFPLKRFLTEEDIEHLYRLFQVKGLSYGNLSARETIPQLNERTFWMTARGIDKGHIGRIGQDVLLVKGVDEAQGVILVSVPPDYDPKARVSVDAVEHALIYREFPEVGAIVHIHAWMENVCGTQQNYPCGTIELAREVVSLLRRTDNPARAVVGLKNHGLTITGPSLEDIFCRIEGRLIREVPMVA
ncbi:class II aldolase/adducin family protein [Calditrichota bacterium GD2]